jgi:predicted Ser/Thr protein kinase
MGREQRILRALAGVEGVPQLLDPIDRDAFAVAVLPGEPLTREAFEAHPSALAEGLRRILRAMHARGVYHLDLRQRQNILVEGETVSIVDFGAAWMPSWASRWLLAGIFRWVDRQAVLKYVARHAPQDLSRDEARSVLRFLRLRRWWIFSPHNDAGEWQAAQDKLREDP